MAERNFLIFDMDDTLYERCAPFLSACRDIFGDEFNADGRLLYKRFTLHGSQVFEDSMNGTISMEEMWIYRISRALEDFQIEISPQEALEFQKVYDRHQHQIKLSETMIRIFNQCKERDYGLGIITNGTSEHQRMKYHALELERWLPEENLLVTGDIGINKPHPAVFKEAERRMCLNPKETWYIGDSYEHDIVASKAVGWNTIWLDRERKSESLPECVADFTVYTEGELEECLNCLGGSPTTLRNTVIK